ncbi:MAG: hypothetical protein QM765_36915 [Myxococcales bacterium]
MPDARASSSRASARARRPRPVKWRELKLHLELYLDLVRKLSQEAGPMIRGSFGVRWRTCGRPNCRCSRGELHPACYLTMHAGGRQRQVHVRLQDERTVERAVMRHRRFLDGLRLLDELHDWHRRALQEICESTLEPYRPQRSARARGAKHTRTSRPRSISRKAQRKP